MSIEFGCRECRKLLRVPETSAGKRARCPACGTIQDVPSAAAATSTQISVATSEPESPPSGVDSPFGPVRAARNPFADGAGQTADNPFAASETNPYAAPASGAGTITPSGSGAGAETWARTCVQGPANSLAAVAGFVLVFSAIGLVINLVSLVTDGNFENSAISVISTLVVSIPYGVVIYGALRMKQLENYPLAITASILVMLPCSGCCILGLPVGIWSLVVLSDPTIRSAFH